MEHNISLITTIAAGFGLALLLGFAAEKIKIPALVGYLFAGILNWAEKPLPSRTPHPCGSPSARPCWRSRPSSPCC
ncbi:MAG: hypothetical protein RKO24_02945 [Candidatus Competibacter sp.]|nr:hypothetical protein [Candidatus Competibacter sp.]